MYESKVEVNISSRNCLPQDGLISHHDLKRVQKINCMEFLLLYVLPYRGSIKNEWTVRNTKVHKGLVMEIM